MFKNTLVVNDKYKSNTLNKTKEIEENKSVI